MFYQGRPLQASFERDRRDDQGVASRHRYRYSDRHADCHVQSVKEKTAPFYRRRLYGCDPWHALGDAAYDYLFRYLCYFVKQKRDTIS